MCKCYEWPLPSAEGVGVLTSFLINRNFRTPFLIWHIEGLCSMATHIIYLPKNLDLIGAISFASELRCLPAADEYVFDFEKVSWIPPFSLLYVSSEIQLCVTRNESCKFAVRNHTHMGYAAHMGFFKAFQVEYGNLPGEAVGSDTYAPIAIFECDELRREASAACVEIGDTIESKSHDLARLLSRQESGDLFDAITYCLREIMRNAVEHSQSNQFGVCAQFWPKTGRVEMTVLDRGIGIRAALRENTRLQVSSDKEALDLAVMPGISGKAINQRGKSRYDFWAHSGFGLYMTSRLCRRGGSFFIASGDNGLLLKPGVKQGMPLLFEGTVIRLNLCVDSLRDLNSSLQQFRDDGYEVAAQFGKTAVLSASTASQMLSRDFRKVKTKGRSSEP